MAERTVSLLDDDVVRRRAAYDIQRARQQLDLRGVAAVATARVHLETAVARLHPLVARDDLPLTTRRSVERCRALLSSHLLAAEDLEAAGVSTTVIARLLRRATDAYDDVADLSVGPDA
jgi:hypothetical protein